MNRRGIEDFSDISSSQSGLEWMAVWAVIGAITGLIAVAALI